MKQDTKDKINPLVVAVLRQRVMPGIKEKFQELNGSSRAITIKEFSDLSNTLIATAMTCLAIKFGVNDIDLFGRTTLRKVFEWITGELNSMLPVDHLYIISLLTIGNENHMGFVALERRALPGWQDFLDPWKVPIAWSSTKEDAERGRYRVKSILSPDGVTIID